MKDKAVHLPSDVQSEFYDATRTLFVHKENKIYFIQLTLFNLDCFDNVFHTFMDLDSAIYYAVNGTVTSLPVFI